MNFITQNLRSLIVVIVIIFAAYLFAKILKFFLNRFFDSHSIKKEVDPTNYNFLKNAINFVITSLTIMLIFYSIPPLKELGLTLLASAGIFAAILGLASQQAFSNIISGIFIVVFRPFRVGDNVEINNNRGIVEDITLRHTIIRNFENRRFIIPNAIISNDTIINSTIGDPKICNFIEIGISYESDLNKAIQIIKEESEAHPNCLDNRSEEQKLKDDPKVIIRVLGYGDSSVNLRAYVWSVDSPSGFVMKCDLYKAIKERFDKEGIEIPYPHRTIVQKK